MKTSDDRWAGKAFGFEPLRGVRYWNVKPDGTLTSTFDKFIWDTGTNVAECDTRRPFSPAQKLVDMISEAALSALPKQKQHDMTSCSCGFHALTKVDRRSAYASYGNVLGVLEGFGEVVEGRLGFRASKGRVIALVRPEVPSRSSLDRFGYVWDRLPKGSLVKWLLVALVLMAHAMTLSIFSLDWMTSIVCMAACQWQMIKEVMQVRDELDNPPATSIPWAKIAERYPKIQLYSSLEAMLEAHPVESTDPSLPALKQR